MQKLTRSQNDRILTGVCAGIAEFLNINPTIIRIVYFLLALSMPTTFILIYIASTIIIPEDDGVIYQDENESSRTNSTMFMGIGLIIIGMFFLSRILFPAFNFRIFNSFNRIIRQIVQFWPVLLILLGMYILFNQKKEN